LVGDPAQLPPIGFGLILNVAVANGIPEITLTHVHRQAESTGIPAVAADVRAGELPRLPRYTGSAAPGVSLLPCGPDALHAALTDLMADLGGQDGCQILAPLRQGETGVSGINRHFHRICGAGRALVPGRDISLGEPVIWTQNDWRRGLMNGALGRIAAITDAEVVAEFDGTEHQFTEMTDLDPVELAYAITVHKAQGSQFQRVVIPVFPSRIMDRTLIYTALTRATEQVVLVGDLAAMREAVTAPPMHDMREVGLRL
jgi:exodeoxyribonuclease V alpha subunit